MDFEIAIIVCNPGERKKTDNSQMTVTVKLLFNDNIAISVILGSLKILIYIDGFWS